jgi:UDP-galactose transporter B1
VIVKSCKMIPVMAVSVLWRKKVYPMEAYMRVSMVTAGIIMFTFFKKSSKMGGKAAQHRQIVGLLMALGSLIMDGFVGPTQEEIFSRYNSSTHQMMFYTNMWALVLLASAAVVTGEGHRALAFVGKYPKVLSKITQFGVLSATGQFFIFFLVRSFSALTLVTVTTTRKFFTVLASIIWFKHPLSVGQWFSVAIVFAGLTWEEVSKYMAKMKRQALAKQEALLVAEAAAVAAAAGGTETEAGLDGGGENVGQGNMEGDDAPDGGAPPPAAQ